MTSHLLAFLVRLAVSAVVLMLSVGWVTPKNPRNTFGRALLVSLVLSAAWYLTLVPILWPLIIPLVFYALIWIMVVMSAYGLRFMGALLLAVALTILSFLGSLLFGLQRL